MTEVAVSQSPKQVIVYVNHLGTYATLFAKLTWLERWLRARRLEPAGFPMAIRKEDVRRPDRDAMWTEIAIPIRTHVPERDGVHVRELPRCTVATTLHLGGLCTLPETYGAIREWIGSNGYRVVGEAREVYRDTNHLVGDEVYILADVQLPVRKERRAAKKGR